MEAICLKGACKIAAAHNSVHQKLQVPSALDPTQRQMRAKRAILRSESQLCARRFHIMLQAQKAVRFAVNSTPNHPGISCVWEAAEAAKPKFNATFGFAGLPEQPIQFGNSLRIDFSQELERQMY
jgi:hypothetical protein